MLERSTTITIFESGRLHVDGVVVASFFVVKFVDRSTKVSANIADTKISITANSIIFLLLGFFGLLGGGGI